MGWLAGYWKAFQSSCAAINLHNLAGTFMLLVRRGVGYVAMEIFAFLELDGLNTTDGGKSFCHQALIENKETVWKCMADSKVFFRTTFPGGQTFQPTRTAKCNTTIPVLLGIDAQQIERKNKPPSVIFCQTVAMKHRSATLRRQFSLNSHHLEQPTALPLDRCTTPALQILRIPQSRDILSERTLH